MKIGYVQFEPKIGQKESNVKRACDFVTRTSGKDAELVVIPEYFNTGYPFAGMAEVKLLSETVPDDYSCRRLESVARENSLYVVGSVCEKQGSKYYNTAILFGPSGFIGKYSKTHMWDEEKLWISPGDNDLRVFDVGKVRLGLMICFDWRFPEVPRVLALKGADVICHPANLLLPYCQIAMLGAAIQNGLFIVTANRVGHCRGIHYTGMSQIVDPSMKILAKSDSASETTRVVEVDIRKARNKQINRFNDLMRDRRPDLYQGLGNPIIAAAHSRR